MTVQNALISLGARILLMVVDVSVKAKRLEAARLVLAQLDLSLTLRTTIVILLTPVSITLARAGTIRALTKLGAHLIVQMVVFALAAQVEYFSDTVAYIDGVFVGMELDSNLDCVDSNACEWGLSKRSV